MSPYSNNETVRLSVIQILQKVLSIYYKFVQAPGYTSLFTGQYFTEDHITFTDVMAQVTPPT